MALAALSGDEQRIIFSQLYNVIDTRVAVAFGSTSSELRALTQGAAGAEAGAAAVVSGSTRWDGGGGGDGAIRRRALSDASPFVQPTTAHGAATAFFPPPNGHDGQWQQGVRSRSCSSSNRAPRRRSTRGSSSRGASRGSLC